MEDDVSGAYRHCKLHPDVSVSHAFIIDLLLFLPLGYVFGSNVVNFRWEIIAQARSLLSEYYQTRSDVQSLVTKHSNLLDKIQFPPDMFRCTDCFIPATADSINNRVIQNGIETPTKNNMYVDNNLLVDTWDRLKIALACSIEALYDILGHPNETLRKSPLSLDKYFEGLYSYSRKQLGRLINTRKLTVSIPDEKRQAVLTTLKSTWHKKRKSFTIREIAELLGTLGDITQTTPFGKYLYIALQHSTYKALKLNTQFVFNSPKFAKFMKFVTSKDSKIARFFQSKLCKETWNVKIKCFVNQTIRAELDNFVYVLSNSSQINLEIPIMHLIPNDCEYTVPGDACSSRGGGYCCEFQFWHCMP